MPEEKHTITRTYIEYEREYDPDEVGVEKTHTWEVRALPFLEALEAMYEHTQVNPTHGLDCSCKDPFITMAANYAGQEWREMTDKQRKDWRDNLYLLTHRMSRRAYY